jgi:MoxR-like ATPase
MDIAAPVSREQEKSFAARIELLAQKVADARQQVSRIVVGQSEVIECVFISLLGGGHVLLEGVPGLGKTLLTRTLAQALALKYSRIQFTPDLMPSDVIGGTVLQESGGHHRVEFQPGPIFANLLLADEINRATPRTQSALLEAMQEKQVTVAGITHMLEEPFFVMATQNPVEMEGTYPLPEAQLDRFFFKLRVPFPRPEEIHEILNRTTNQDSTAIEPGLDAQQICEIRHLVRSIPVAPHVQDYAVRLILATHPEHRGNGLAAKYIRYGSSPRGAQALVLGGKVRAFLQGRFNISADDVRALLLPALRHRVLFNFEAQADNRNPDELLLEMTEKVSAS